VSVVIDNCPHQVVLAGPAGDLDPIVGRLCAQGVLCEDLPFTRAYHTPNFAAVLGPLETFYASLELHPNRIPIYSCSTAARMPACLEEVRRLAVEQWIRPVAFRETIEAMYRDGLRIFVDVGARGNLCGYVEDILRGRPSFAVAANLPRRSGTLQLNHLVASLFSLGLDLDTSYLYARRRPRRVDLDATSDPPRSTFRVEVGFPEMKLSAGTIQRLTHRNGHVGPAGQNGRSIPDVLDSRWEKAGPRSNGKSSDHRNGQSGRNGHGSEPLLRDLTTVPTIEPASEQVHLTHVPLGIQDVSYEPNLGDEPAMLGFLETMNAFLDTQREVMEAYLRGATPPVVAGLETGETVTSTPSDPSSIEPGPWVGEILEWQPGRAIMTRLSLAADGDPVAENHTLGGRRVSALRPELKGLPVVPFAVMAEMIAQVGSLLVPSGSVLGELFDVRAQRWVPYEQAGWLELRGVRDTEGSASVRVSLFHHREATDFGEGRLVFEGVARFTDRRPDPEPSEPLLLTRPRASRFTARSLYEEQWLFHGPPMQALAEVGPVSPDGITGTIEILPLAALVRHGMMTGFHSDSIVLDTFTHLLGCWGLDCLEGGDVIFPLRMGRLTILGDSPPEGTLVDCRIRVVEVEHHRVRVDAEIVRPDGLVWMRIDGWEDWRFHWPARYRDVFRAPDTIFLGEELALSGVPTSEACAVWLAPPDDMARPVWRDVLECTQLGPEERLSCPELGGSEDRRTHRLWGRVAAKEAARRIWQASGQPSRYPADLAIESIPDGRPILVDRARPDDHQMPVISIAHVEGLVVALAARHADSRPGIDVVSLCGTPEAADPMRVSVGERALLSRVPEEARHEWAMRLRAARQAAAKAVGIGPGSAEDHAEVRSFEIDSCDVIVEVRQAGGSTGEPLIVRTERRGDHVWAWTLGERKGG